MAWIILAETMKSTRKNLLYVTGRQSKSLGERTRDSKGESVPVHLRMLLSVIKTIPVSTATWERIFSGINLCTSPQRVTHQIDHVTTSLFRLLGTPLSKFIPDEYMKTLLFSNSRRAEETGKRRTRKKMMNTRTVHWGASCWVSRQASQFLHW
jgi:hypothetical protein